MNDFKKGDEADVVAAAVVVVGIVLFEWYKIVLDRHPVCFIRDSVNFAIGVSLNSFRKLPILSLNFSPVMDISLLLLYCPLSIGHRAWVRAETAWCQLMTACQQTDFLTT